VLLLQGYGETGDMWGPMAAELARDHTVIVPDLRKTARIVWAVMMRGDGYRAKQVLGQPA